jgi:hypothetical protein
MFPDFDEGEDEDLKSLVSWGLPGYAQSMANTKAMGKAKTTAGKSAKRATGKTKGSTKSK